jgi:hypothetical protein
MFYLSRFLSNTRLIGCLIIIDLNKLIRTTTLFHLEIVHNKVKAVKCLLNDHLIAWQLLLRLLLRLLVLPVDDRPAAVGQKRLVGAASNVAT